MKELSLIIATYNRAASLLRTLHSVAAQNIAPERWECIVVDNNSTDSTQLTASDFIAQHPTLDLRVVFEREQGLSSARNRGIAESKGEIIAIIDDDETINPEFVSAYINLFTSHPEAGSAGGIIIASYETARPRWMSRFTEQPIANPMNFGLQVCPFPKGRIPGGGNMALRRSVLDIHGNFNTALGRTGKRLIGGEESDLFERLHRAGVECWYTPHAKMWHIIPPEKLTPDYFERLSLNIGRSHKLRAQLNGNNPILPEVMKWCATLIIALGMLLSFAPSKAKYLIRMRWFITKGILS